MDPPSRPGYQRGDPSAGRVFGRHRDYDPPLGPTEVPDPVVGFQAKALPAGSLALRASPLRELGHALLL